MAKYTMGDVPIGKVEDNSLADRRYEAMTYNEFIGTSYRSEMLRRLQYYEGNQFVQDTSVLSEQSTITPKLWKNSWSGPGWTDIMAMLPEATEESIVQPVGLPFVKIVIDNQMVVYTVPPKSRRIIINGEAKEKESELLQAIYNASNHDLVSDQFCKWTGLFGTAFQFISYDKRRKSLVKRNLPPYQVYIIPAEEDPTDLQHENCLVAVAQTEPGLTSYDNRRTIWQVWWKDEYWYEQSEGFEYKDLGLTIEGRNKNPYKDEEGNPVKPILAMHDQPTTDMYFPGSDLLVLLNQRLDRNMTSISNTMEYQGFAIPTVTGATPEEVESQPWSPGALFLLERPEAKLGFSHPASPISELLGAIVKQARAFARMLSIDPELVDPETKVQSGVSRAQARLVLAERREEQFPKWLVYERESYWLSSIIWNTHVKLKPLPLVNRFDNPIDNTTFELEVVFGELDPVVDPLADALMKAKRVESNLNTTAELIAAERRISLKQAIEKEKEIREINNKAKMEQLEMNSKFSGKEEGQGSGNDRIGQSGNRPQDDKRSPSRSGENTTSFSGNDTIGN